MTNQAASVRSLTTNGFKVELPDTVDVIIRSMPNPADVKSERKRLAEHWFVHWMGGNLYHLRLQSGGPNVEGTPTTLEVEKHPWLLRARLEDAIGTALEKYTPVYLRPFTFLARLSELIADAANAANIEHPLLSGFSVTPKFALNAKIYELIDGSSRIGLFVTLSMSTRIEASLIALQEAGVDLSGMYVVRREAQPGKRRGLGRITAVNAKSLTLSEATDATTFATNECMLEGSKENFSRCLKSLLGTRYKALMDALEDEEAKFRLGPAFDSAVSKMGEFLSKKSVPLGIGVTARIAERITLSNDNVDDKAVYVAPTVDYVFDRTGAKSWKYAWPGLMKFGPYDRTTFAIKSPLILVVFPESTRGKVEAFLKAFGDGLGASSRGFPKGFSGIFGLVKPEFVLRAVDIAPSAKTVAESRYRSTIEAFLADGTDVHAAIVVLFDEHAFLEGTLNPYIRTKSLLLTLGIPTQEVRMATVTQPPASLQYTLQNIAVALYAKLNGTPWTVSQDRAISDELVVGVGIAELSGSRIADKQRFVGITTVFSGDGTYLLGNVSKECHFDGYASAVREAMLSVLRDVKARNNWQHGDTVRVIFHAHYPLKRVDVAKIVFECTRQIGSEQSLQMAFLTITHDHPFYIFDKSEEGVPIGQTNIRKGAYAPKRGTIARIGRSTRLLAINAGRLIKRANTPLPAPLLLSLHTDSTFKDIDYLAEQVLKFTSLSWRSTMPASTSVTIFYSERIAELLGRLRQVPDWSPSALATKLRWSRWFL
jgi:hypothetical protein